MTQEQKAAWVAALRSGKYQQGNSRLRNVDGSYCCLGVLCDVIGPDDWDRRELRGAAVFFWGGFCSKLSSAMLREREQRALMAMNDAPNHRPFPEIADWIEKNVRATL